MWVSHLLSLAKFINRKDEDTADGKDGRVIYFSKAPPQSSMEPSEQHKREQKDRSEFAKLAQDREEKIFSHAKKGDRNSTLSSIIEDEKKEMANIQTLIRKQSQSLERAKKLFKEKQVLLDRELGKKSSMFDDDKFAIMGQLSSRMAHDIRNPLNVIKLQVDLLKLRYSKQEDGIMLDSLGRMEKAVNGITVQLNDVLDFLKSSPLQTENTSLKELLTESLLYIHNHDSVVIELPSNDVMIKCDINKMQRVFVNILQNSLDVLDKEGTITISASEKRDRTVIEIADTGSGVPEEHLDKLFDPLFTTKPNGTGLGLSICKKIVRDHGGTITAKNNPTTFTISLPKDESNAF